MSLAIAVTSPKANETMPSTEQDQQEREQAELADPAPRLRRRLLSGGTRHEKPKIVTVDSPHTWAFAELTRNAVDVLPEGALEQKLALGRPLRVKLGIDVTAPDITSAAASRSSACAPSRTRATSAS